MLALKQNLTRSLGVTFRGREVHIDMDVASRSLEAGRRFVVHVDTSVSTAYPDLQI